MDHNPQDGLPLGQAQSAQAAQAQEHANLLNAQQPTPEQIAQAQNQALQALQSGQLPPGINQQQQAQMQQLLLQQQMLQQQNGGALHDPNVKQEEVNRMVINNNAPVIANGPAVAVSVPLGAVRSPPLNAGKLLIGSWLLKGSKPDSDVKSLFSVEVRFVYAPENKVVYEINQPGASLIIDYDFNTISGLHIKTDINLMVVELSQPPNFSAKENGKTVKVLDFTHGNASYFRRHYIELFGDTLTLQSAVEQLLSYDPRLAKLAEIGLPETSAEPSFVATAAVCDWDKDNFALVYCHDCGQQNYCVECDEVLHRHPDKRHHRRVSTYLQQVVGGGHVMPPPNSGLATPNKYPMGLVDPANKKKRDDEEWSGDPKKKKKIKQQQERCRCGTGASRGTLGKPCTGNRCPCFSEGRDCSMCGCKNCQNPYNNQAKAAAMAQKGLGDAAGDIDVDESGLFDAGNII